MKKERKERWSAKTEQTKQKWEKLANKLTDKIKAKSEQMREEWEKKENKDKVEKVIGDVKKWYRTEVKDSEWGAKAEEAHKKMKNVVKANGKEVAAEVKDWISGWF